MGRLSRMVKRLSSRLEALKIPAGTFFCGLPWLLASLYRNRSGTLYIAHVVEKAYGISSSPFTGPSRHLSISSETWWFSSCLVLDGPPVSIPVSVTDAHQNGTHTRSNKQQFFRSGIPQKNRRKRDVLVYSKKFLFFIPSAHHKASTTK